MENKDIHIKCLIVFVITLILLLVPIYTSADVGSFESYESDSWSSSSYDYDYDYDYGSDYSTFGTTRIGKVEIILSLIVIIIFFIVRARGNDFYRPMHYTSSTNNTKVVNEEENVNIEDKIKTNDEFFNEEEFLAWVKELFVKLQEAWTKRDWSSIRCFESNELFNQHQKQLQGYIDNYQINKMERICVKTAKLSDFKQSEDKDILTVILSSKMVDYIIDDRTEEIIKGDKTTDRHSVYKMVFIRKKGVKTKEGNNRVNTTNCPNCGAPTNIGASGKCDYCGSVVTTGEFNWVLSNLEKIG